MLRSIGVGRLSLSSVGSGKVQALPWVRYITQNGDYQLRMVRLSATPMFFLLTACSCLSGGLMAACFDNVLEQLGPVVRTALWP